MPRTLFTNISIFDGSGQTAFPGEGLVQGNRIKALAKGKDQIERSLAEEIVDGGGATLMPGLTEAQGPLSYTTGAALKNIGKGPAEEQILSTSYNARLMLDSGFTSVYSAASSKPR